MKLTRIVLLDENKKIIFMLTEPCRAQSSETPCDQLRLGEMSFQREYSFIAPGSFLTQSAPGYRITKHIEPSRFNWGHLRDNVYIYCPPCACQVATALDICQYRDSKDKVEFIIRIDPQQITSCSMSASRIEGLISVIEQLK